MGETLETWFSNNSLMLEIARWLARNWEDPDYDCCRVCGQLWERDKLVEENGQVVAMPSHLPHKPDCLVVKLLNARPDFFMEEPK